MPPCMGKTIAAVFLRLSAASVKGFLSWLLLSALLLQLSEPVSDALLFGRSWRSALLFHLTLPFGKVTVVLFHNGFRLPIGRHECLHIGITVLFQNIGQFIQIFSDFLFCPLYLLCERLALLTFENPFCLGKLLFQFRKYRVLQMPDFFCLILRLYHQLLHGAELCHIYLKDRLRRHIVFTD